MVVRRGWLVVRRGRGWPVVRRGRGRLVVRRWRRRLVVRRRVVRRLGVITLQMESVIKFPITVSVSYSVFRAPMMVRRRGRRFVIGRWRRWLVVRRRGRRFVIGRRRRWLVVRRRGRRLVVGRFGVVTLQMKSELKLPITVKDSYGIFRAGVMMMRRLMMVVVVMMVSLCMGVRIQITKSVINFIHCR
jgi:hypothetical protein